ncbi:proteasome assembly chaperone 1-like [Daphnia pulex]|uniref:proteasome assembly chaperone 1-like n=1 Tax=Daphnia pulex TaxID=6669 RepID=UPI001EDE7EE0|nr:proteasome assembly chaperone 1-like [Daphnia pulex]XP_046439225.1 proteasome assembly chaperone 1-like [Daphnia pulex]XP_046439226.1 proteasome assembly chaperone 1-like [Daphnia pulex]
MESTSLRILEDPKTEEIPEDDDDEGFISFATTKIPTYTIQLDENIREKCKTVILSEGLQATEFAKNHLPLVSPDPIGKLIKQTQLDKSDIEIWGLQYKEPEPSLFFQISQDILLCTCSSTMSSEDFYLFSQTVINSFKSTTTVLILTVSASSNFKSDDHPTFMETPLMRTLATSNYSCSDFLKGTRLEQPNILGGVAAGILTVCDIKEVPAIACVVFSSTLNLEADMVEGFTKFLGSVESTRQLPVSRTGRFPIRIQSAKTGNLYI